MNMILASNTAFYVIALLLQTATATEELTKGTLSKTINSGKNGMVRFFQTSCGHCTRMKPDWDKLSSTAHSSVFIADVNCGDEQELCEEHGVSGYPTIKYFIDGKGHDYNDARSYEALNGFINDKLMKKCDANDEETTCTEKEDDTDAIAEEKLRSKGVLQWFKPWLMDKGQLLLSYFRKVPSKVVEYENDEGSAQFTAASDKTSTEEEENEKKKAASDKTSTEEENEKKTAASDKTSTEEENKKINIVVDPNQVSIDVIKRLKQDNPKITNQLAVDCAALIKSAHPETIEIAQSLKDNLDDKNVIFDLRKKYNQEQIVTLMINQMDKMKMLTILFENPARAFVDLREKGLISKDDIKEFKGNPNGYADKMTLEAWYNFIKIATAGDYF